VARVADARPAAVKECRSPRQARRWGRCSRSPCAVKQRRSGSPVPAPREAEVKLQDLPLPIMLGACCTTSARSRPGGGTGHPVRARRRRDHNGEPRALRGGQPRQGRHRAQPPAPRRHHILLNQKKIQNHVLIIIFN
jgi:hypothetical protein